MSRLTRFSLILLGAALIFLVITLAGTGWGGMAYAMRLASTPPPNCYTWGFLNNTDQDANDLHLRMTGVVNLTSVYTGTMNPFGLPDSSGYDPITQTYHLDFSNATAGTGEQVMLGFCSSASEVHLDVPRDTPPFYWSLDGQALQPAPLFVGVKWNWQDASHVQITLENSNGITLTLMSLNLLEPGVALPLEDLSDEIAAMLPMTSELAPDVQVLAPGGSLVFDVAPPTALARPNFTFAPAASFAEAALQPMQPYVLQALLAAEDDPGNVVYLVSQSNSPPLFLFMPVLRR